LGPGAVVGMLSTVDPNSLDVFTYSLVPLPPPASAASFTLSGAQVVTNRSVDFEATPTLLIMVQATDDSGAFVRKTLTITVLDRNDVSTGVRIVNVTTGAVLPFVDENLPRGTVVGRLAAIDQVGYPKGLRTCVRGSIGLAVVGCDPEVVLCACVVCVLTWQDCCDTYRYAMVDDSKTFALQAGPGGTTQIVTMGNINFEALSLLTVLFTVDDDRGPSFSLYSTISVRDLARARRVHFVLSLQNWRRRGPSCLLFTLFPRHCVALQPRCGTSTKWRRTL
jgi:hypothetical protein